MILGWVTDFNTMVQGTLAFKITGGPEAVWCAQRLGAVTALGSCLLLTSKNGRGTRHREEHERPTSNSMCCLTVMGTGAVNRNFGVIVHNLTSFIPIGQ